MELDPTGRGAHEHGAKLDDPHTAWNALARLELMLQQLEGRQ